MKTLNRIIFTYLILLFFVSCINKTYNPENNKINKKKSFILKINLIDSLNRFSNLDEALLRGDSSDYVLYIKEINENKIAVIAITDSLLFIFQQINGNWIQKDSILFKDYAESFEITDINGDFHDDLLIYGHPNMHGQNAPYVFLSDKNKNLHYRPDIHLFNIKFDKEKQLIKSFYEGNAYGENNKEYYQWKNDSLYLVRGVMSIMFANGDNEVTFYKLKNGKRFNYKILNCPKEIVYDTALWTDK
ncbi:MAG: hypothetical protein HXX18_00685 [Bacteroidetes bacterium]|nr:hypothetical protein [Bacteroidota bacterium]